MATATVETRPGTGPRTPSAASPRREVVAPSTVEEVADVLREAGAQGRTVVPVGGRSKTGWAAPRPRWTCCSTLTRLDRVVEHTAGDLVVVAQAGVRLADLQSSVAGAGQQLALDPPEPGATLGGIVSANASRPAPAALRHRPRPAHRRHRRAGRRHHRQGRRQGGQERRRLRPRQAAHRRARQLGVVVSTTWRLHPLPPAAGAVVVPVRDAAEAGRLAPARPLDAHAVRDRARRAGGPLELVVLFESIPASSRRRPPRRSSCSAPAPGRASCPPGSARAPAARGTSSCAWPTSRPRCPPSSTPSRTRRRSRLGRTGVAYAALPAAEGSPACRTASSARPVRRVRGGPARARRRARGPRPLGPGARLLRADAARQGPLRPRPDAVAGPPARRAVDDRGRDRGRARHRPGRCRGRGRAPPARPRPGRPDRRERRGRHGRARPAGRRSTAVAGLRRPPPAGRRPDRRLRPLRLLPADLPHLRAVGRGDGQPARSDRPHAGRARRRAARRRAASGTSTSASGAWPA